MAPTRKRKNPPKNSNAPRKTKKKVVVRRSSKQKRFARLRATLGGWKDHILSRKGIMVLASVFGTFFIMGMFFLVYFAHDLPDISGLAAPRKNPGITVLANDGSIIANYGDIYGEYQNYGNLPKNLVDAVVATEDRNFFHHFGVDPMGIVRAMAVNIKAHRFVQGGSTITQQLAKNVFLTPERTLKRKFQEMLLAFWLENRFSKQEILSIYLNRVYLGAGKFRRRCGGAALFRQTSA